MRTDDNTNYHTWDGEETWNYGKEIWCNMAGRYMHIVADLKHLLSEGTYVTEGYVMGLCNLGIMGTQYVRD